MMEQNNAHGLMRLKAARPSVRHDGHFPGRPGMESSNSHSIPLNGINARFLLSRY